MYRKRSRVGRPIANGQDRHRPRSFPQQRFVDRQAIQVSISTTLTEFAFKVLAGMAFWIVGCWLIGRVIEVIQAGMHRNKGGPTLTR